MDYKTHKSVMTSMAPHVGVVIIHVVIEASPEVIFNITIGIIPKLQVKKLLANVTITLSGFIECLINNC